MLHGIAGWHAAEHVAPTALVNFQCIFYVAVHQVWQQKNLTITLRAVNVYIHTHVTR